MITELIHRSTWHPSFQGPICKPFKGSRFRLSRSNDCARLIDSINTRTWSTNSLYSHSQSSLTHPEMTIEIESLNHAYGNQAILQEISLAVAPGEVLCVLGPSGSGKSTLLRLIAGLEPIQAGRLRIGDSEITVESNRAHRNTQVGLVFQDHALFPHMTVAENIRFGLKGGSEERINSLLALVELTHFQDRYPHTLSGGQQQRVALIRALAMIPSRCSSMNRLPMSMSRYGRHCEMTHWGR